MTYKIIRFFRDSDNVDTGIEFENEADAQTWCSRPESTGNGWFEGYQKEEN